ncbi:MAG: hypothetical protein GX335_08210 [Firmicutes bacterium]|nr:hypothetical protein [Bacillota bacterium]
MVLIILVTFTMGYWLGRKIGRRQGLEQGLKQAVFKFKADCLKKQFCPICCRRLKQDLATTVTKEQTEHLI